MPEKTKESSSSKGKRAEAKAASQQEKQQKERPEQKPKTGGSTLKLALIAIVAIAVLAALFLILPNSLTGVNFSTFKSNFDSASSVAVVATYYNESQYAQESACFSSLVEVIAYTRQRSTINFYLVNAQSDSCEYSKNGLVGLNLSVANGTASQCRSLAAAAPASLYLNYSSVNSSLIYANKMYVYGNGAYMVKCPITVNLA